MSNDNFYKPLFNVKGDLFGSHYDFLKQVARVGIYADPSNKIANTVWNIMQASQSSKVLFSNPLLDYVSRANNSILGAAKFVGVEENLKWNVIAKGWKGNFLLSDSKRNLLLSGNVANQLETFRNGALSHLMRMSELTSLAQASVFRLAPENIGNLIMLNEKVKHPLYNNFSRLSNSYSKVCRAFQKSEETILSYPPEVSGLSAIEFFNAADLMEKISFEEDESEAELAEQKQHLQNEISQETEESLEMLLNQLSNDLVEMWKGACQALNSNSPDFIRHFSISSRELITQTIHKLAPDDEIKAWTSDPSHFDQNNRPTRKARFEYICRDINLDPFSEYLNKDLAASLKFFDLLNKGTHSKLKLNPAQLKAIKIRLESTVRTLIVVSKINQ